MCFETAADLTCSACFLSTHLTQPGIGPEMLMSPLPRPLIPCSFHPVFYLRNPAVIS